MSFGELSHSFMIDPLLSSLFHFTKQFCIYFRTYIHEIYDFYKSIALSGSPSTITSLIFRDGQKPDLFTTWFFALSNHYRSPKNISFFLLISRMFLFFPFSTSQIDGYRREKMADHMMTVLRRFWGGINFFSGTRGVFQKI